MQSALEQRRQRTWRGSPTPDGGHTPMAGGGAGLLGLSYAQAASAVRPRAPAAAHTASPAKGPAPSVIGGAGAASLPSSATLASQAGVAQGEGASVAGTDRLHLLGASIRASLDEARAAFDALAALEGPETVASSLEGGQLDSAALRRGQYDRLAGGAAALDDPFALLGGRRAGARPDPGSSFGIPRGGQLSKPFGGPVAPKPGQADPRLAAGSGGRPTPRPDDGWKGGPVTAKNYNEARRSDLLQTLPDDVYESAVTKKLSEAEILTILVAREKDQWVGKDTGADIEADVARQQKIEAARSSTVAVIERAVRRAVQSFIEFIVSLFQCENPESMRSVVGPSKEEIVEGVRALMGGVMAPALERARRGDPSPALRAFATLEAQLAPLILTDDADGGATSGAPTTVTGSKDPGTLVDPGRLEPGGGGGPHPPR